MGRFRQRIIKNSGTICQFQAVEDNGLPAYYFIALKPEKITVFEGAIETGNFDLSEYGEILHSGYGFPKEQDKKHMLENFNFEVQPAI